MNNNRFNNTNRHARRATESARAYTKKKAKRTNIIIATIALSLVAVVAAGVITFTSLNSQVKTTDANSTSISAKADTAKVSKALQNTAVAEPQKSTQASQDTTVQTVQDDNQQTAVQTTQNDTQQTAVQTAQNDNQQAQNNSRPEEDSNIKIINGERVYIDTARPVPENSGTPVHFNPNGKTSYGFDWTYDADNNNIMVRCDYNFDRQQYDFQIYGLTPGTAHITVYYNTDDNTRVPAGLTVSVDNDLNATLV